MSKTTTKTKEAPEKIDYDLQNAKNPLWGLFEISKKREIGVRWERLEITESKDPNEDGEYKQHCWRIALPDGRSIGEIFFCPQIFKFYHLGLKQGGLDGKDKADRMGSHKAMPETIKALLKNNWRKEYKAAIAE